MKFSLFGGRLKVRVLEPPPKYFRSWEDLLLWYDRSGVNYTPTVLDDPPKPIGSEEDELLKAAVATISDVARKQRIRGKRFYIPKRFRKNYFDPRLFTQDFWIDTR